MVRTKGSVKANRERTDREKLELFIHKVDDLHRTRLAKTGFQVQFQYNIQIDREPLLESNLNQPDELDFMAYLSIFRHFISEKEDVFLSHILNICSLRLTSDVMKQNVAHLRESYKQVKQHNGMHLIVNGRQLTPLQVTDIYINGKYFHNDLEYQQQLDSLNPFKSNLLRSRFLNFVINTSKIIDVTQSGVDHALQDGLLLFNVE